MNQKVAKKHGSECIFFLKKSSKIIERVIDHDLAVSRKTILFSKVLMKIVVTMVRNSDFRRMAGDGGVQQ